jgi:hypothetical protein
MTYAYPVFHWATVTVLLIWALGIIVRLHKSPAEHRAIADYNRRRGEHDEWMNQHYRRMNTIYGRRYEKIDEGWWTEDPTLLAKYSGLVAHWKGISRDDRKEPKP